MNRLVSFLNEVELLACNGRKLVTEPILKSEVYY